MSPDRDDAETRAQAVPGEPPVPATGSGTVIDGETVPADVSYGADAQTNAPYGAGDRPTAVDPHAPPAQGTHRSRREASSTKRRGSFAKELPFLVLIAFVLALLIKAFLVQAFWIPSGSMEKTLLVNDRVLVNKVVYRFRHVHRGEIVVFNGDNTGFQKVEEPIAPPSNGFQRVLRDVQGFLGLGAPSDKDFIKRVIGVGGDTVACCDTQGRVTVNGKALNEPYIYNSTDPAKTTEPFTAEKVPKGDLWVMGDHRDGSSDSRVNQPIPEKNVVGRAFVRVWPVTRFSFLTVPKTFHGLPTALGADPSLLGGIVLTIPIGLLRRRRRLSLVEGSAAGAGRRPGHRLAERLRPGPSRPVARRPRTRGAGRR